MLDLEIIAIASLTEIFPIEMRAREGIPGTQKKEVVMSTVKEIYKEVNPDLPWIPEPFESMIENLFLEKALDAFIDFIVAKYKETKIFE